MAVLAELSSGFMCIVLATMISDVNVGECLTIRIRVLGDCRFMKIWDSIEVLIVWRRTGRSVNFENLQRAK